MKFVKKDNMLKKIILLAVVSAVLVGGIYTVCETGGFGGNENTVYVNVPQGANLKNIARLLKESDVIGNELLFYVYAKNQSSDFKFGGHIFNSAMSYSQICEELNKAGTVKTVKVLVPEGYELRLIAEACEKAGLVTAEEFMEVAQKGDFDYDFLVDKDGVNYKLEGFLFPATYEFNYGTSAYDIIDKMLETFDRVYTEEYSKRARELNMSDYDIVTLASVIERETANSAEHKKVSGVFYNRIEDGMNLQSCATVQYILKERKPVLSIADTKIDSPYNTYQNPGLPIGPVASPGKSAIEAALYPESHNYYYFVAKADGSGHIFSKTLEEHNRATAQNQ